MIVRFVPPLDRHVSFARNVDTLKDFAGLNFCLNSCLCWWRFITRGIGACPSVTNPTSKMTHFRTDWIKRREVFVVRKEMAEKGWTCWHAAADYSYIDLDWALNSEKGFRQCDTTLSKWLPKILTATTHIRLRTNWYRLQTWAYIDSKGLLRLPQRHWNCLNFILSKDGTEGWKLTSNLWQI